MQILESNDLKPKIEIEILMERSLLTCDDRAFKMHDLFQETGKKIVI